jgi:hypothetical protein
MLFGEVNHIRVFVAGGMMMMMMLYSRTRIVERPRHRNGSSTTLSEVISTISFCIGNEMMLLYALCYLDNLHAGRVCDVSLF